MPLKRARGGWTTTALPISPLHSVDPDADDRPLVGDSDDSVAAFETDRPAEAQRRQLLLLALPPATIGWICGIVGAALFGGAIGYWLGNRRRPRPTRRLRHVASTLESAADLAPVVMRLLSNPIVRAAVVRTVARQLSRRAAS